MKRIGILVGRFDPISEKEIQEALNWRKDEHLDLVCFEVLEEGILPKEERMFLLDKAIAPYRKLSLMIPKGNVITILRESSREDEDKIQYGHYRLAANGTKKYLAKYGFYFETSLRKQCKKNRYIHSLGVAEVCVDLARAHGLDERLAWSMGMLHDITKNMSDEYGEEVLRTYHPEILSLSPKVWHSYTAPIWIKQEMGIYDPTVLHAIEHHTLGTGTNAYDRILYIADKCEPNRGFDATKEISLSKKDLKEGFSLVFQESEEYRKKEER